MSRKRKALEHSLNGKRSKRLRSCTDNDPNISEVSDDEAVMTRIPRPPPKSEVCGNEKLLFPMSRDARDLPSYEGPQMRPFRRGPVEVQFVREIGTNATHSNVFEVMIGCKPYALKMFRTFTRSFCPDIEFWEKQGRVTSKEEIWQYYKPFNCECRAYARITERGIADRYWKCYGYLRLPAQLREQLYKITGLPAYYWQVRYQPEDRDDKPTTTFSDHLRWPIYGLVKELAPQDSPAIDIHIRSIRRMHGDLRLLHKAGIANNDMGERNYIAGRLVDFSQALTLPHIYVTPRNFKTLNGWELDIEHKQERDRDDLRDIILESRVKTRAVQAPVDENNPIFSRLRENRRLMIEQGSYVVEPLYELGVLEPKPPRQGTPASMYA